MGAPAAAAAVMLGAPAPALALNGVAGIRLADVFLAMVTLLILRILYLVGRIEGILGRRASRVSLAEGASDASSLPHVTGVLTAGVVASEPPRIGCVCSHADDACATPPAVLTSLSVGATPPSALEVDVPDDFGVVPRKTVAVRREVTVAVAQGPTAAKDVSKPHPTPKRRSSRGSLLSLHTVTKSGGRGTTRNGVAKNGAKAVRESDLEPEAQALLESLDVLPLTTPEEAPLLTRMRIELAPDLATVTPHDDVAGDIRLLRFLRGYGHSVSQACSAYRAMLATRLQHDVESIRRRVLSVALSAEEMPHGRTIYPIYPMQLDCGLSKRGNLISVDPVGSLNLRHLLEDVGADKFFEFMIGVSELRQIIMDEMSVESGKLVQSVQVKDLHGLSLSVLRDPKAISTLQSIISTCTSMYPESLAALYIVNAPFFFPMVWSVISNFVNERTKRKVRVLGTDYAEELRAEVGEEVVDILQQLQRGEVGAPTAAMASGRQSSAGMAAAASG